jgi:hypothetical protein
MITEKQLHQLMDVTTMLAMIINDLAKEYPELFKKFPRNYAFGMEEAAYTLRDEWLRCNLDKPKRS